MKEKLTDPRARGFRLVFSLRTLFVVMAVVGLWLGYTINWIRQRHAIVCLQGVVVHQVAIFPKTAAPPRPVPLWIGMFGEEGVRQLELQYVASDDEIYRIHQLFPEADIVVNPSKQTE